MQTGHTRRFVSLCGVALALVTLATLQVRAESVVATAATRITGGTPHADMTLFGNTGSGTVGTIQDSIGRGGPGHGGRDTTGQYKRDSVYNSWRQHQRQIDSLNHVRDSINRAVQDSIRKAHQGHPDTTHHRDTTVHGRRDTIPHQHRDSTIDIRRDSAHHVLDSLRHIRLDSLRHAIGDTLHVRDSLIKGRRDSLHVRDSINNIVRDSLIRAWRDSMRVLDSIRHAGRIDTTHHSVGGLTAGQPDLGKAAITPDVLTLSQNYPNPFGGAGSTTAIEFALPSDQNVALTVYNAAGQQVAVVTNGMMKAGTHSVTFDATGLSAGMYFYKLVTETGMLTKRMIKVH